MLDLFKALADITRLRLVAILSRGEFTVQELTAVLEMGQSRISRHLKILTEAEILTVKRQGTWAYYRLNSGNSALSVILPLIEGSFGEISQGKQDLANVRGILERRRRRSLEFFDQHAQSWDSFTRELLPVPAYLEALLKEIPQSRSVLEVGIGTGNVLPALRAKAPRIVGVDHSPAMLEEARSRVLRKGLTDIEFRLGEMSHLPVGDGEMDCLLLNMVLHHAAEPEQVFKEAARILTVGGVLVLADLQRHDQDWVRERLADQWLGFDTGELERGLAAAGFSSVRVLPLAGTANELDVFILTAVLSKPYFSSTSTQELLKT